MDGQNDKSSGGGMKSDKIAQSFLIGLLLILTVVFFSMVQIFILPIILAAVFSGLFYPIFRKFLRLFKNRRSVASLFTCLLLLLILLIPTYVIADRVAREAIGLYENSEQQIRELFHSIQSGESRLLRTFTESRLVQRLGLERVDWQTNLEELVKTLASSFATVINKATRETLLLVTNLFVTFFAMFYFFRDGDSIVERLKYLSPLKEKYEDEILLKFQSVSKATIKGTLLIGLIKGVMGGITFWIFGIPAAILWGVVMVILSVIPLVGGWLVMYPAALILILTGQVWEGIAVFLIAALIIGNIDNILAPKLIGHEAGMHELLIFVSTLGGLSVFGIMGFVIGPIIAAMFMTVLDVYAREFRSQLESPGSPDDSR